MTLLNQIKKFYVGTSMEIREFVSEDIANLAMLVESIAIAYVTWQVLDGEGSIKALTTSLPQPYNPKFDRISMSLSPIVIDYASRLAYFFSRGYGQDTLVPPVEFTPNLIGQVKQFLR